MSEKTFYLTTPIFYPNASPHLGHAYTTLLCDVLARYHRLTGEKTYFLTGTDEHTEKVVKAAQAAGQKPGSYLEEIVGRFKRLYAHLNVSYDQFIRTSDRNVHWPGVIEIWKRLDQSGDIYKSTYTGLYCAGCEAFLTEKDLVDGKCSDHGIAPERIEEENYFFRLSKYTERIKDKISSDELRIVPETRKKEILSVLETGLQDISFSRPKEKMSWGVPVPGDESQTIYIWADALSNYITALGYGRDETLYKEFWPGMHVIGKDILRFHAAIWPGMLLSAGLPLPKTLLVHGFITSGGKKMSKSLGNIIDPEELLAEYGTDAVRYFLLRHISPFGDGDITLGQFKAVYNGELADGLGNTVARIMQLAQTHLDTGTRPEPAGFPPEYVAALEGFEVNKAVEYIWSRIASLNQKITETEPFKLVKSDAQVGKKLIFEMTQELYLIGRLLDPFMPDTSAAIKKAVLENSKPASLFPRKE